MLCVTQSYTCIVMLRRGADFPTRKFLSKRPKRRRTGFISGKDKDIIHKNLTKKNKNKINDDKVVISLNINKFPHGIKHKVSKIQECAQRAIREVKYELRSSPIIISHGDHGVDIAFRRSSMVLLGKMVVFFAAWVLAYKLLRSVWSKLGIGRTQPKIVVRRDRSLGGREVVVGVSENHDKMSERNNVVVQKQQLKKNLEKAVTPSLPSWWPSSIESRPVVFSDEERHEASMRLDSLLQAIQDKASRGMKIHKEEILHLRQMCKEFDMTVNFPSEKIRDSFYRAAINFVIDTCSRDGTSFYDVAGEEATHFLSGLARNIGIKPYHAVMLINAAVARQTHSSFSISWALQVQGKEKEAHELLSKLSGLYDLFPQENSSQLEMVALGLKNHFTDETRKNILKMYSIACGTRHWNMVAKALGFS